MDDWNEPRLVLAVHRAGSLTGAAKALGIDHSTAFRRLNAVETRLGVRLFERLPGGSYEATAAGERMAATAERMKMKRSRSTATSPGGIAVSPVLCVSPPRRPSLIVSSRGT